MCVCVCVWVFVCASVSGCGCKCGCECGCECECVCVCECGCALKGEKTRRRRCGFVLAQVHPNYRKTVIQASGRKKMFRGKQISFWFLRPHRWRAIKAFNGIMSGL